MTPPPDLVRAVAAMETRLANIGRLVDAWNLAETVGMDPVCAPGADRVSNVLAAQLSSHTRHHQQAAAGVDADLRRFVGQCRAGLEVAAAARRSEAQTSNR